MNKTLNIIFSCIGFLIFFSSAASHAQHVKVDYERVMREISREISQIPKIDPDDFPAIKGKVAFNRSNIDVDLTNQNTPDESEKRELIKFARAVRDYTKEVAEIYLKYSEDRRNGQIKNFLIREYEILNARSSNAYKIFSEGIKNGSSYAEINKLDKLDEEGAAAKRAEETSKRDQLFAAAAGAESKYVRFNGCVAQIAKNDSESYQGYPEKVFVKIKNEESCREYKSGEYSVKSINDFLGTSKPLTIQARESENYRFDHEFSCSLGSTLFGGLVTIRSREYRQGQLFIPECVAGLGVLLENYNKFANLQAQQRSAELARQRQAESLNQQQSAGGGSNSQTIQSRRELAAKDPVAQALNYAAGGAEDASGPNFFYPVDNSSGRCLYATQSDNSMAGQLSQSLMGAFASIAPLLAQSGIQVPNTTGPIDLTRIDYSSIAFYNITGSTPGGRYSQPQAYLKYQTRIEGLPDYFVCDSNTCSIERLRRAWGLIANRCKGVKKAF
jgi:hypothetical protein